MSGLPMKTRVQNLEISMQDLREIVARTSLQVERTSAGLAEFKEENRLFREEMREFKEEMREFKDEMKAFKDEMKEFKDKMLQFQDDSKREKREFNRQLGDIANKYGRLIEDIVAPSICRVMKQALGFDEETLCFANERIKRAHRGDVRRLREFYVVAECCDYVMINETKSSLKAVDVADLIDTIAVAREYFPEYRDRKIIGSVASVSIDESVVNFATKNGILALAVGDELMDIQNPAGFTPAVW